jgi:hypothetical protein
MLHSDSAFGTQHPALPTQALDWIAENEAIRAEKAATKLGDRTASEGRIAVVLDGPRGVAARLTLSFGFCQSLTTSPSIS